MIPLLKGRCRAVVAYGEAEAIVAAHVAAQPALMAIPAAERQAAHASH